LKIKVRSPPAPPEYPQLDVVSTDDAKTPLLAVPAPRLMYGASPYKSGSPTATLPSNKITPHIK